MAAKKKLVKGSVRKFVQAKKKAWKSICVTGKPVDSKIKKLIAEGVAYYNDMNVDNYHGCGNGFIVIDKETGRVNEMQYTENGKVIDEQNIMMCRDAGDILEETENSLKVRANFSCHTACLF